MKVKNIMTREVIFVKPEMKIKEVADLLSRHNLTGLPVINDNNKVVGIVSESDFMTKNDHLHLPSCIETLQAFSSHQHSNEKLEEEIRKLSEIKVSEIMTKNVVIISPDASMKDLANLFVEKRVNPIPVINEEGRLVGIISRSDMIKVITGLNLGGNGEEKEDNK